MIPDNRVAVDFAIAGEELKPQPKVKPNGRFVDRRSDGANLHAAKLRDCLEKLLIQEPAITFASRFRMNPDEMNVAHGWIRLRAKSNKKADKRFHLNQCKAGGLEMFEEQARQQATHRSTAPPVVDDGRDDIVVGRLKMSDVHDVEARFTFCPEFSERAANVCFGVYNRIPPGRRAVAQENEDARAYIVGLVPPG